MNRYDDIIDLEHWHPKDHPRMSVEARASQFAPFAALTGYDDAIRETARTTDACVELDAVEAAVLNMKMARLIDKLHTCPEIEVTHFVPDPKKEGGEYVTHKGRLRLIDSVANTLIFTDGTQIPLSTLKSLTSPEI